MPAKAAIGEYGTDSGCPVLAVPAEDNDGVYPDTEDQNLYPLDAAVYIAASENSSHSFNFQGCEITAESGTYYDGANHLWILNDDMDCLGVDYGANFDILGGTEY